ncbi:MAG TPA: hypothetical protein VIK87_03440 [Sphingomonadales bacterium]|jgi:uncharacterized membrane protein
MENTTPPPGQSNQGIARSGPDLLVLAYIFYLVSIIVGVTAIVGLVISYMQRGESAGTWRESHCTWLIRTFWIGLLFMVVGAVTSWIGIGFLIWLAAFIWYIVRLVKGWMAFSKQQPVANPESWLFG